MSIIPKALLHAYSRCGLCIFLVLLYLCSTGAHLSWGQESVLDRGPAPESVLELNSPLDIPFLPLAPIPWVFTTLRDRLHESLKPQLDTLPPFLRDSQVGVNLRLYYFNQANHVAPPKSDNEALTIGGSLAYQTGWLADILRLGIEGFGSLKLYGPEDRDGTLLLLPGQLSYAALGRAYGEVQYAEYTALLYRQYIDTPYVNQHLDCCVLAEDGHHLSPP